MKYIEIPELTRLAMALNHEGPECSVHTRLEAYSCKSVKRDKRLFRTLENAYETDVSVSPNAAALAMDESTPFGPFDQQSSRKTLFLLISLLNVAFPDHDFSDLKPAHFNRETSGAQVLNALSTTLVAPQRAGLRAPRTYSSYPPASNDFFPSSLPTSSSPHQPAPSPFAPPPMMAGTHPSLYRVLDDVIGLGECDVYSYEPDLEADPHAVDFDDDSDEDTSSSSGDDSPEETFAFDDYDVDLSSSRKGPVNDEHEPTRRRGSLLWSSHWFFLNRKLKRILFVSVHARSRGAARWADSDEDSLTYGSVERPATISGERFLGWEGAVGAGARAMGIISASV